MPNLKLPYNTSDDPWHAAQRFIHQNELSQYYLEQVANFIIQNTKGVTLGSAPTESYADPLTGRLIGTKGGGGTFLYW